VTHALPGHALGAAAGVLADRLLGEPPLAAHPVAVLGTVMRAVEGCLYGDSRARGLGHAGIGVAIGVSAGRVLPCVPLASYVSIAGRALALAASQVADALSRGDLEAARRLLPNLVGRDPSGLDEQEVARAVVESVAENTVDAVVAPALWSALAGAPGAFAHRAVNTLDAMVGHRSPRYRRYGWASARLDDAAAWVPARLTAALVAAVRPRSARVVVHAVRADAPAHPSPNAGVAEAAFAAALGLRLGGENRYDGRVERRPRLGHGRPPELPDIARAVRLSGDVGLALSALLAGIAGIAGIGRARARRPPARGARR
jgi:adenosylcobinamide-phosphate synthase